MNNSEIRYLGNVDSYSHEAALNYINKNNLKDYDLTSYKDISTIIKQTSLYNNSILILPLENSTSGDVYETFKLLYETGFNIIAVETLEIQHVLIIKKDTNFENVTTVYSHPQALIQTSEYLNTHNLMTIADFSTSEAINRVSNSSEPIAAIGSSASINLYDNLKIVSTIINNHANNHTKFIVCKYQAKKQKHQINLNNTLDTNVGLFLLFELDSDKSGDLLKVLNILSEFSINLYNIKSKPIEGKKFEYYFIVEAYLDDNLNKDFHYMVCDELKKNIKNYIYNTYNL